MRMFNEAVQTKLDFIPFFASPFDAGVPAGANVCARVSLSSQKKTSVALLLAPLESKTGSEISNGAVEVGRSRVVVLAAEFFVLAEEVFVLVEETAGLLEEMVVPVEETAALLEEMVVPVEETAVVSEEMPMLVIWGMKGRPNGSESNIILQVSVTLCELETWVMGRI